MRLTKQDAIEATVELLAMLPDSTRRCPRTSDLIGTKKFHGTRTLTARQIIRLLRASGRAVEHLNGAGRRTWFTWTLKKGR